MKPILISRMQRPPPLTGVAGSRWALLVMLLAGFSPIQGFAAEMPISAVQETLKREQFFYGEPSGKLDEPTHAALRRFQIRYGLPVSGEIDKATLQALQSPREKDGAVAPVAVAGTDARAGSASSTTVEKDRDFLQDLQQSGTGPGKSPAVPAADTSAANPATASIVGRGPKVVDDAAASSSTRTSASDSTRRVVTRTTTTTTLTAGAETDDDPDPLGPHGVRIIRPPGTVSASVSTVSEGETRVVAERRTTTVSGETPLPARAPASPPSSGPFPQADEPPSRVLPETTPRQPPGFLQKLFRGDR